LPKKFFLRLYNKKDLFRRSLFHSLELANRLKDLFVGGLYDVVVVQKGLTSLNVIGLEKIIKGCSKRIIFDFDDAVFGLTQVLPRALSFLQDRNQTSRIMACSDAVIAGNAFLADFARRYNNNVCIIPTAIDVDVYTPLKKNRESNSKTVIGWSGSSSTNRYVNKLIPVLNVLGRDFSFGFKIISNDLSGIQLEKLDRKIDCEFIPWDHRTEVSDLRGIDIGTMPLEKDAWSNGKCGLKALQYMALSIPAVCSPVGVNKEIIDDKENGYLPDNEDSWINTLSLLLRSEDLRRKTGQLGRKTVEERYSLRVNAPKLKRVIETAYYR
jgi:glycosyltransferase involved in cell wall biosynthesis